MRWKLRAKMSKEKVKENQPKTKCLRREEERFRKNYSKTEEKERPTDMFM